MAEVSAAAERSSGGIAKMGKAAALLGVALAGGVAYGLVKSVEAATKFQSSMELIQTQAGGSAKEVKNMSKALLDMAASVGTTPEELSKGLYHVESAGFRGAKALSILRLAAEGAAVGHADLEQTTTALVAAERTGIKGLGDMSHAMGTLNAIVGAGNMRMDDLTSALGTGLLVSAKAFGISIQDAGGALATMTRNGIPAVNAASGLKMLFASMAAPTHAAAKAFATIGLSSTDLATTMRSKGLGPALVELKGHMRDAGLNAVQSAALLTAAFGKKSSTGLLTLIGNLDQMKKATDQVKEGAKGFGKNWEEEQKTAEFATKKFHAAIAALEIRIGAALLPTVTRFTNWLTRELPTAITTAQNLIKDLTPAFDKVRDAIEAVGNKLGDAISVFMSMKGHSDALKAALGVVAAGISAITAAALLMNLAFLANPIVLLVVGLAALAAGLVLAYENSKTFRDIVNEAFSAVKTAASAALGYITGTLIPLAIAEWQKFGPQVKSAIQGAISAVQQGMADIKTAVTTVLDFIKGHWDDIWSVLGPLVKAALQVVKTDVQTTLNVVADVVRAFSDILHGRWGAAWGELKNVVSDVLNGIVSITGSMLTGLAGSVGALAKIVGEQIVKGIKWAVEGLAGLAGDLWGKISGALSQVARQAYTGALKIGEQIAAGALKGVEGLPGKLLAAVNPFGGGGTGNVAPGGGGKASMGGGAGGGGGGGGGAQAYGKGIADGILAGFSTLGPKMQASLAVISARLIGASKQEIPGIVKAFKDWASNAKSAFDQGMSELTKKLGEQLKSAETQVAAWKARLTPAEITLNTQKAKEQLDQLTGAVNSAFAAADALPMQQMKDWNALLAQQAATMAQLKASAMDSTDTALLAGNTYQKNAAGASGDPLAAALIDAQKSFDAMKSLHDQGLASDAQFIAAANALDDAKTAASQDSNATMLLDQYNTWQQALAAQTTAGAAITAQQASDLTAQQQLQSQQQTDSTNAWNTYYAALQANGDAFLTSQATASRTARNTEATELNTALVKRYDRIKTHLDNVKTTTDTHYTELEKMATTTGKTITDNLATAMGDAADPGQPLQKALIKVSALIAKYLKTNSPSELGPLSDLDHWWDGFAPALIKGLDTKMITSSIAGALNPSLATGMGGYGSASPAVASTGGDTHLHFNHTPADADPVAIASTVAWQMRTLRS